MDRREKIYRNGSTLIGIVGVGVSLIAANISTILSIVIIALIALCLAVLYVVHERNKEIYEESISVFLSTAEEDTKEAK